MKNLPKKMRKKILMMIGGDDKENDIFAGL